jgi:protein-L-isoaspartate(D-aspartate) O-methyltransferase
VTDEAAAQARRVMVAEQMRARGIRDERVLAAMERVPRELFIPPESRAGAYEYQPVPIG